MGNIATETIMNWGFSRNTNGFQVDVQDQISPPIDFFFAHVDGQTTLSAVTAVDDKTLALTDATGFVDGTYLLIRPAVAGEEIKYYIATQNGAAVANVITVDTPLDGVFQAGDTVFRGTNNMAVDGSVTPVVFEIFGPRNGSFDVTRIMVKMLTASAVSLDLFGDLTALTEGVTLRHITGGVVKNIWNIKTNSDLALLTFDYSPFAATNPVQGQDGAFFRNTFAGQDKHGVALRLTGEDDKLQLIIQDDLSGLTKFKVIAEGHQVID